MSKLMTLGPVAANTNNQIPLPLRTRRKLNNAELLSCWIAGKSKPLDATSVPIKTSSEAPAQRNEGRHPVPPLNTFFPKTCYNIFGIVLSCTIFCYIVLYHINYRFVLGYVVL